MLVSGVQHQFSSVAQLCLTLCDPVNCSTPGLPVHHQLPEFTQTQVESVMPSSHLILCRPLLLLPLIHPRIRVSSTESALCMRWPKYWSFSFSIIPSKEHPGLISLQSKGLSRVFSNTTVQKHQFFGTQPSSQPNSHNPYMTTGKTIALTRRTFVGKVMSLLLNMLSRLYHYIELNGIKVTYLPTSSL